MGSLQLLLFQLIITTCSIFGGPIQDEKELKPCPKIKPFTSVDIDQVRTNKYDNRYIGNNINSYLVMILL